MGDFAGMALRVTIFDAFWMFIAFSPNSGI